MSTCPMPNLVRKGMMLAAVATGTPGQPEHQALISPRRWPILGWLAKYLLLPLAPFVVASAIRMIDAGSVRLSALEPDELAFSLAMFCLFTCVSAHRLEDEGPREAVFAFFVLGVAVFMSMFALAILESARLNDLHETAIVSLATALGTSSTPPLSMLPSLAQTTAIDHAHRVLRTILLFVALLGLIFGYLGARFRADYGLGD